MRDYPWLFETKLKWVVAWILFAPVPTLAFAQTVLFENGQQVEDYNNRILSVETGSVLQFSEGEQFKVEGILGHGNATLVLDVGQNRALRIPLWRGRRGSIEATYIDYDEAKSAGKKIPLWFGPTHEREAIGWDDRYSEIHRDFGKTYRRLELAEVDVVKMDLKNSVPGEYFIAEKFDVIETLDQFLARLDTMPAEERKAGLEQLSKFLESTFRVASIGDATPRQVGLNGKEMKLMDFRGEVTPIQGVAWGSLAKTYQKLVPELAEFFYGVHYGIMGIRQKQPEEIMEIQQKFNDEASREKSSSVRQSNMSRQLTQSNCNRLEDSFGF